MKLCQVLEIFSFGQTIDTTLMNKWTSKYTLPYHLQAYNYIGWNEWELSVSRRTKETYQTWHTDIPVSMNPLRYCEWFWKRTKRGPIYCQQHITNIYLTQVIHSTAILWDLHGHGTTKYHWNKNYTFYYHSYDYQNKTIDEVDTPQLVSKTHHGEIC